MNKFISIGLLLLCFDRSAALNVHIVGVAEGRIVGTAYASKNLGAFTSQRIILDECDIDSAGNFRLSFECVETQQIFISINRVSANLYVHPGDVFNVLFPSEEHVDFRSFANSRVRLKIEPKSNLTDTLWQIDSAISGFVNDYFFDYAFQQFRGPESYLDEARRRAPGADLFKISAESDSSYDV
ncbi:MAG: hypothetical protein ACKOW8_14365, partial [Flavobacteriales bacterium]